MKIKFKNLSGKSVVSMKHSSDFDLTPNRKVRVKNLRPAAILIPILINSVNPTVILTTRAKALSQHPGQISFPGGKVENSDQSEASAALREAHEEIGLKRSEVDVIGELPRHETTTGFLISPIIGLVKTDESLTANPKEVADIFMVPLDFLLNKDNMFVQTAKFKQVHRSYYTIPYGPHYIWGATARIIKTLADEISL